MKQESLKNSQNKLNSSNKKTEETINPAMEERKFTNVEDTPFTIVSSSKGHDIVIGNQIVSDKRFNTMVEALDYINSKPYMLIAIMNLVLTEKTFKL